MSFSSYWEVQQEPIMEPSSINVSEAIWQAVALNAKKQLEKLESKQHVNTENLTLELCDPFVAYAINSHKLIQNILERNSPVEIPEPPQFNKKFKRNRFNCLPTTDISDAEDSKDEHVEYPEIAHNVAKQALRKSVVMMLAQIGYTDAYDSTLSLFTDVVEQFFKKISTRLKTASEEELNYGLGGFPSFPERVLVELGFGGMDGLQDYYQTRVVNYCNVLHERCKSLLAKNPAISVSSRSDAMDDKFDAILRESMDSTPNILTHRNYDIPPIVLQQQQQQQQQRGKGGGKKKRMI